MENTQTLWLSVRLFGYVVALSFICLFVRREWPEEPFEMPVPIGKLVSGNNGLSDVRITNACVILSRGSPKLVNVWVQTTNVGIWIGGSVSNAVLQDVNVNRASCAVVIQPDFIP